ncbi:MAG: hypothetical protein ABEH59_01940 [Halobacteriales archaeon]
MIKRLAERYTLVRSFVLGALAYLSGYLITFVWLGNRFTSIADHVSADLTHIGPEGTTIATESSLSYFIEQLGGISSTVWAGWLFSNAHFVPLELETSFRVTTESIPNILLAAEQSSLLILFLIPPIALLIAGWLSGRASRPSIGAMLPAGASQGLLTITGYLPLTLAGVFLFSVSRSMDGFGIGPDLLLGVVMMGILYPVIFGGIGGWLSTKFPTVPDSNDPAREEVSL